MQGVVEQQTKSESEAIAAHILSLIASGEARSRLELAEIMGLSRSTIADRLGYLLDGGLISERAHAHSARGRPTRHL